MLHEKDMSGIQPQANSIFATEHGYYSLGIPVFYPVIFSQTSFLSSWSHILEKVDGAVKVLARRTDLNEKAIKEPSVALP